MGRVHEQSEGGGRDDAFAERMDPRMAEVFREKTPAERIAVADGMWRSAREMLERLIASEHTGWSAERVGREASERLSHGAV